MAFLDKTDVERGLDSYIINELTDSTDSIVVEAIADAEARVREKISPRYDLDTEFAKISGARDRSLLKHCIALTIYYLYERLNTRVLPEAKVTAWQLAEVWLDDVYKGNINVNLATNDDTTETGWPLRWGSQPKKGNQTY
tara:strand:- start:4507 stop:4926 length:420 start_codon:yes stop_codon:yes gene_type:complete